LPYFEIENQALMSEELDTILNIQGPCLLILKVDPEQTYYPKITSRVLPDGSMASNPLHLMTPDLSPDQIKAYLPYLVDRI